MKPKSKLLLAAGACACALVIVTQTGRALAQSVATTRLQALLPEMSQFCGQNALQIEVRNTSSIDVADRIVVVRKLPMHDPRLKDGNGRFIMTDFRTPSSGTILVNGTVIPMVLQPDGSLLAVVSSSLVNWFAGNQIQVFVRDAQGAQLWEFGLAT